MRWKNLTIFIFRQSERLLLLHFRVLFAFNDHSIRNHSSGYKVYSMASIERSRNKAILHLIYWILPFIFTTATAAAEKSVRRVSDGSRNFRVSSFQYVLSNSPQVETQLCERRIIQLKPFLFVFSHQKRNLLIGDADKKSNRKQETSVLIICVSGSQL